MFPVVYQGAATLASGPTPGAKALMAWCLANYPPGTNLGIYNPRNVRGGAALSLHAEGRAIDVGYPVSLPDGHHMGQLLATDMAKHHAELGVQCVIFARKIWSNTRPTWRHYDGAADHFNHVHIELTREAADGLTADIIRQTLEATTVPTNPPSATEAALIEQWQGALLANGAPIGNKDGLFGRLTLEHSRKVLDHRNQLLAQVEQLTAANTTSADTIKRLVVERDDARAVAAVEKAEADRLQAMADVATRGPALLAILQGLRAQLNEAEAKLQGLA